MRILIVLFSILFTLPTFAHWQLDNETSVLSFITTKKLDIAEVHRFNQLSGEITQQGDVSLAIDLSSVNSSIAIRDERIKEFLFETAVFPKATFTTQINQSDIADLTVGETKVIQITGELTLHGKKQTQVVSVMVVKLGKKALLVSSLQPFVINAAAFNLVNGIQKLRDLAKLPSISNAVPVSFVLHFKPE
jgi:polyisoprenoid-binding protein YceI